MKKSLLALVVVAFMSVPSIASAYTIGGAYASQLSCNWGQYGNLYGWIGTYNVNGQIYSMFFGNTYCPY